MGRGRQQWDSPQKQLRHLSGQEHRLESDEEGDGGREGEGQEEEKEELWTELMMVNWSDLIY